MRLMYCDRCDGPELAARLQPREAGRIWTGACNCGGTKTLLVLRTPGTVTEPNGLCSWCGRSGVLKWQGRWICEACWRNHIQGNEGEPTY